MNRRQHLFGEQLDAALPRFCIPGSGEDHRFRAGIPVFGQPRDHLLRRPGQQITIRQRFEVLVVGRIDRGHGLPPCHGGIPIDRSPAEDRTAHVIAVRPDSTAYERTDSRLSARRSGVYMYGIQTSANRPARRNAAAPPTSDPYRWPRLLQRRRIQRQPVHRRPPAGIVDRTTGKQLGDQFESLVSSGTAFVHRNTYRLELGWMFAADADTEVKAPVRHLVERGHQLRRQRGRIDRQYGQCAEQPYALGGAGGRCKHDKGVRGATMKEEVLAARDMVEPTVLGPARRRRDLPLIAGQDDAGAHA